MLQFVSSVATKGSEINKLIGSRIREARISSGLTQSQLGKRIFKTGAAVGLVERGKRGVNIETLIEISHVLSVPVDFFFSTEKTTTQHLQSTLEQLRINTQQLNM